MRLIDADALIERINEEKKEFVNIWYKAGICIVEEYINDAPTVEEISKVTSERTRGKWILPNDCVARYLDEWSCSNCNHLISHRHNFCPNCGADMRGDANDKR